MRLLASLLCSLALTTASYTAFAFDDASHASQGTNVMDLDRADAPSTCQYGEAQCLGKAFNTECHWFGPRGEDEPGKCKKDSPDGTCYCARQ